MTTPATPAAAVSLDDLSDQLLECIDGSPWLTCHVAKSLVRTVADELHMAAARESALIAERDALQASRQPQAQQGHAGVTAWIGDRTVSRIVTEIELRHERKQGEAVANAASRCLEELAALTTKDRS